MDPSDYHSITPASFTSILQQYPSTVPAKLAELDEARYNSIPKRLGGSKGDEPSLSKNEVATLVDWKLSHGKFRPTLRALVQQNSEDDVEKATRDAFASFAASPKKATDAKSAINMLTKLRGIGPATASLLLSVFDPDAGPFFSDELYRWCMFEKGTGRGWDRSIKYDLKEYLELYERVGSLRERFRKDHEMSLAAVDIEKVAYVLGKQSMPASATSAPKHVAAKGKKREMDPDVGEKAADHGKTQTKHTTQNERPAKKKPKLDSNTPIASQSASTPPTRRSTRNRTQLT